MYEDLIYALRKDEFNILDMEAADAIENLEKEIEALKPNYRVPSLDEYFERHGTKKQVAGYEARKEK